MTEEKTVEGAKEARAAAEEPEPPKDEPLQFDKAEFEEPPAAPTCTSCSRPIESTYFQIAESIVCPPCKDGLLQALASAKVGGRFWRGALYGSGAALVGTIVWYAIRKATGYEIGLVAIGVGILVGVAVKRGAGGLGGRRYQALAVALTYASIALANLPLIFNAITEGPPPPPEAVSQAPTLAGFFMAWAFLFLLALASPFLAGFENIIGIVIIGIGLYEAWKINRYVAPPVRGPFEGARAPESASDAAAGSG